MDCDRCATTTTGVGSLAGASVLVSGINVSAGDVGFVSVIDVGGTTTTVGTSFGEDGMAIDGIRLGISDG